MSQTVMFHNEVATVPAHSNGFGMGVIGTRAVSSCDAVREVARERILRPSAYSTTFEVPNPNQRGFGENVSAYSDGAFGISFTAGDQLLGLDVTGRVWGRNHLTLSGSA